eukprot:scaffold99_cov30-Phaeocystis_antarctica.AAC.1
MDSREQLAIDVAPQNKDCAQPTHEERAHVCPLCPPACLPAPRGLALPVREPVSADYSRTSCCCSSSRLTVEYDGVRGCTRW